MPRTVQVIIAAPAGILTMRGPALGRTWRGEGREGRKGRTEPGGTPERGFEAAREVLASVRRAELVRLKVGRTVYRHKPRSRSDDALEVDGSSVTPATGDDASD